MAKVAPSGLGVWVAFGKMIPGGVDGIIKQCTEMGFDWIAPRLGDGDKRDGWYTPTVARELCAKAHALGMKVYPWIFNRPTTTKGEVVLYKACLEEGADGLMLDAEVPYGGKKTEAAIFVAILKKEFPDVWIGNAPFSYIDFHQPYPYLEFGKLDAAMDQFYWTEFNQSAPSFHAPKIDAQWEKFIKVNPNTCVRLPIGVTYGSELAKKWGMPKGPPGPIRVEDVKWFLDHYAHLPAISLYSLEATEENVRKFLKERAAQIREDKAREEATKNVDTYRDVVITIPPVDVIEEPAPPQPVVTPPVVQDIIIPPKPNEGGFAALLAFIMNIFRAFFGSKK